MADDKNLLWGITYDGKKSASLKVHRILSRKKSQCKEVCATLRFASYVRGGKITYLSIFITDSIIARFQIEFQIGDIAG